MRANLGEVLGELGEFDEAITQLQSAARLNPWSGWPNYQMGRIRLRQGRAQEALVELRQALRLEPNNPIILAFTARVLSAAADPSVRDGKAAVELALRSCALARGDPANLDVLGMALAEVGDFAQAQAAASNAVAFARALNKTNYETWNQRLELYQRHQPWRESFTNRLGSAER
jgi:tetratricopeptide (TPR) repeat protein